MRVLILSATVALATAFGAMTALGADADVGAIFAKAKTETRVGTAQKTKPVDARPATVGEIVVTVIKGEGVETRSKPAEAGDFVVRNRCPATGNEEYLVKAAKFAPRYVEAGTPAAADGWKAYVPQAKPVSYFIVGAQEGSFSFQAPWGEAMVAKPGDAIVQDPQDVKDTYRIQQDAFACTYQIVKAP